MLHHLRQRERSFAEKRGDGLSDASKFFLWKLIAFLEKLDVTRSLK